jgi:hypothetical protein
MMLRAVVALLVLASPAFAQHGGSAGSTGSRGFAGHAGISRGTGFSRSGSYSRPMVYSRPGNYSRPAQPPRNSAPGNGRFQRPFQFSSPAPRYGYGNRLAADQPQYRPEYVSPNRGGDRDHDRFRDRRREFGYWNASVYPGWIGYPYELNPGFLDWGDYDDSTNEQGSVAPGYPDPYLEPDYASPEGYPGPGEPEGNASVEQSATPEEARPPLTVIFKDGRAAESIENYMMTATVLTNFDSNHYERIPLDQIDLAATQQANRANGVDFQIPNTSGD